jgi:hypothetical protein
MVHQRAFNHVKTTSQLVLAYPDYFYSLESYTNASNS